MSIAKEEKGNYVLGVLGAVIGGIIGTLPWILCYVYGNMMYAILSVFIPICAFKGFEILYKGKPDKKFLIILGVISLIAITLATLVVIPHLLVIKETGHASMELYKALFKYETFKSALIEDYIYSVIFTILGAGSIILNMKKSIEAGDEKITWKAKVYTPSDDEIEEVKSIFKKKNAMSKDSTLPKDDLMSALDGKKEVLNFLLARGIIVRKGKTYYYSEENEAHPGKRTLRIFLITFGVMILFIGAIVILTIALS